MNRPEREKESFLIYRDEVIPAISDKFGGGLWINCETVAQDKGECDPLRKVLDRKAGIDWIQRRRDRVVVAVSARCCFSPDKDYRDFTISAGTEVSEIRQHDLRPDIQLHPALVFRTWVTDDLLKFYAVRWSVLHQAYKNGKGRVRYARDIGHRFFAISVNTLNQYGEDGKPSVYEQEIKRKK